MSVDFEQSDGQGLKVATAVDLLGGLSALTIGCWIKPESFTEGSHILNNARLDDDTLERNATFRIVAATGELFCKLDTSGSGWTGDEVGLTCTTGAWQYVALVWDGTTLKGYRNGAWGGTTFGVTGTITSKTNEMILGVSRTGVDEAAYDGLAEDRAVWNRALSKEELDDIYNGRLRAEHFGAGLIHYWPLDTPGDETYHAYANGDHGGRDPAGGRPAVTCTTGGPTWSTDSPGLNHVILPIEGRRRAVEVSPGFKAYPVTISIDSDDWIGDSFTVHLPDGWGTPTAMLLRSGSVGHDPPHHQGRCIWGAAVMVDGTMYDRCSSFQTLEGEFTTLTDRRNCSTDCCYWFLVNGAKKSALTAHFSADRIRFTLSGDNPPGGVVSLIVFTGTEGAWLGPWDHIWDTHGEERTLTGLSFRPNFAAMFSCRSAFDSSVTGGAMSIGFAIDTGTVYNGSHNYFTLHGANPVEVSGIISAYLGSDNDEAAVGDRISIDSFESDGLVTKLFDGAGSSFEHMNLLLLKIPDSAAMGMKVGTYRSDSAPPGTTEYTFSFTPNTIAIIQTGLSDWNTLVTTGDAGTFGFGVAGDGAGEWAQSMSEEDGVGGPGDETNTWCDQSSGNVVDIMQDDGADGIVANVDSWNVDGVTLDFTITDLSNRFGIMLAFGDSGLVTYPRPRGLHAGMAALTGGMH